MFQPGGLFFLADFRPLTNPVLAHVTAALVGYRMMQFNVWGIPRMLTETGFVDVASGPTRSAFLAFVRRKKPTS